MNTPNDVADNPLPNTAIQIKTTKPKIKQTALNFLSKCSLQQCYLIGLLRTTTLKRKNQAKELKTDKCEKAVGLIGLLGNLFNWSKTKEYIYFISNYCSNFLFFHRISCFVCNKPSKIVRQTLIIAFIIWISISTPSAFSIIQDRPLKITGELNKSFFLDSDIVLDKFKSRILVIPQHFSNQGNFVSGFIKKDEHIDKGVSKFFAGNKKILVSDIIPTVVTSDKEINSPTNNSPNNKEKKPCLSFSQTIEHNLALIISVFVFNIVLGLLGYLMGLGIIPEPKFVTKIMDPIDRLLDKIFCRKY